MAVTQIRGSTQIKSATVTEVQLSASVAGAGISGGAGTALALDINELTSAVVDPATDSFAIVDSSDANASRKEAIADLITAIAGNGLGATSGVLAVNVDASTIEINADTLRVKAAGITNNELGLNSVESDNIVDGSILVDDLRDFRVSDNNVTSGSPQTVAVAAGRIRSDNTVTDVSATASLSVTASATNYIEVDAAGSVTTNTTGFTTGRLPIATVVVSAAPDITSVNDKRAWLDVEIGASGLTSSNFVDREVVAFDFDGVDTTGVLAFTPTAGSEHVYLNGILQEDGGSADYTISGATITFNTAPVSGDFVVASYRK